MTIARAKQIDLAKTPFYHCMSRCVRQYFLQGRHNGKNYDYRKLWIKKRLAFLLEIFAIDLAAYAIMDNHYHLVLHINTERAQSWTDEEVINKTYKLFPSLKYDDIEPDEELIAEWRERLSSISTFMSRLNENIAKRANKEDKVTGCFWVPRFRSKALFNEHALLTCMAYVDLNQVHAKTAKSLLGSNYSSISQRIKSIDSELQDKDDCEPPLMKFVDAGIMSELNSSIDNADNSHANIATYDHKNKIAYLPFTFEDYHALVSSTALIKRDDKAGALCENAGRLLKRYNVKQKDSIKSILEFERLFSWVVGDHIALSEFAFNNGKKWIRGMRFTQQWHE